MTWISSATDSGIPPRDWSITQCRYFLEVLLGETEPLAFLSGALAPCRVFWDGRYFCSNFIWSRADLKHRCPQRRHRDPDPRLETKPVLNIWAAYTAWMLEQVHQRHEVISNWKFEIAQGSVMCLSILPGWRKPTGHPSLPALPSLSVHGIRCLSHGLASRLPNTSSEGSVEVRDAMQAVCCPQPQDEGICRLSPGQRKQCCSLQLIFTLLQGKVWSARGSRAVQHLLPTLRVQLSQSSKQGSWSTAETSCPWEISGWVMLP